MPARRNPLSTSKFFGPTIETGLLLLSTTIGLVILASDNLFVIGLGWLTFLIGIVLVLMGTLQNQPIRKSEFGAQLKKIERSTDT
jgi:hypothetical protein